MTGICPGRPGSPSSREPPKLGTDQKVGGSNPFERTTTRQLSAPVQTLAALAMLLTSRDSHQSGSGADELPPSEPGRETVDEIRGRTCAIRMDTLVPPGTIEPADLGSLEVRGGRPALIGAPVLPQIDQG
jgi:hypothetical protein